MQTMNFNTIHIIHFKTLLGICKSQAKRVGHVEHPNRKLKKERGRGRGNENQRQIVTVTKVSTWWRINEPATQCDLFDSKQTKKTHRPELMPNERIHSGSLFSTSTLTHIIHKICNLQQFFYILCKFKKRIWVWV